MSSVAPCSSNWRTKCGSALYSSSVASRTSPRPSIRKCICVRASFAVPPAFAADAPATANGDAKVRAGYASTPTPLPTLPARVRPKPRWTPMVSGATPGAASAGSRSRRSPALTSTRSPSLTPSFSASATLISAALSQVSVVPVRGKLLHPAVVGEAAVVKSLVGAERHLDARCGLGTRRRRRAASAFTATCFSGDALPAIMPSCTPLRHAVSKSP